MREKIYNHLLYWIFALKLDHIVGGRYYYWRYNCNIIIIIISIFTILLRVKLIISYLCSISNNLSRIPTFNDR